MIEWLTPAVGREATAFACVLGISVYLVRYITDAAKRAQAQTTELMAGVVRQAMDSMKTQGDAFLGEVKVQRDERHLMCTSHMAQLEKLGDSTTRRLDQIGQGFAEMVSVLKKQNGGT